MIDITGIEGETLEVDYSITNSGDFGSFEDVELLIDGNVEYIDQDVMITDSAAGTLYWQADLTGTYTATVSIAGVRDQITVQVIPIPNNTVAHYDASQLDLNDGDTVSVWPDVQGDNDLDIQTGSPTYVESALNGNPAIAFDRDALEGTGLSVTQPNTTYVVFEYQGIFDGGRVLSGVSERQLTAWSSSNTNSWRTYAGNNFDGSSDIGIQQMTAVFDGANSIIREDGVETAVGDAGTNNLGGLSVGYDAFSGGNYANVYVSEIVIVDSGSVDLDFENQLLKKWGITA